MPARRGLVRHGGGLVYITLTGSVGCTWLVADCAPSAENWGARADRVRLGIAVLIAYMSRNKNGNA